MTCYHTVTSANINICAKYADIKKTNILHCYTFAFPVDIAMISLLPSDSAPLGCQPSLKFLPICFLLNFAEGITVDAVKLS